MKYLFILCFLSFNLMAPAAPLMWYEGSLVLKDKTVLTGKLSVEPVHGLVLFQQDETIKVYPAHKIQSLFYYDAEANINRKFISLKEENVLYNATHLYEIVLQGEYSVLRRQRSSNTKQADDKFDFEYYIRKNDELTLLSHFRSKIYPRLLVASREQIIFYVHNNKLDPHQPAHAIQILEYYNQLSKLNALAAF